VESGCEVRKPTEYETIERAEEAPTELFFSLPDSPSAYGLYHHPESKKGRVSKFIFLDADVVRKPEARASLLRHELGHSVLRHPGSEWDYEEQAREEFEANYWALSIRRRDRYVVNSVREDRLRFESLLGASRAREIETAAAKKFGCRVVRPGLTFAAKARRRRSIE